MKRSGVQTKKLDIPVRPWIALMPALLSMWVFDAHAGLLNDYRTSGPAVAQVGTQPLDVPIARGTGHNVTLDAMLQAVVPRGFEIHMGNVEPSLLVFWNGGLPWDLVLSNSIAPLMKVRATIDWTNRTVSLHQEVLGAFGAAMADGTATPLAASPVSALPTPAPVAAPVYSATPAQVAQPVAPTVVEAPETPAPATAAATPTPIEEIPAAAPAQTRPAAHAVVAPTPASAPVPAPAAPVFPLAQAPASAPTSRTPAATPVPAPVPAPAPTPAPTYYAVAQTTPDVPAVIAAPATPAAAPAPATVTSPAPEPKASVPVAIASAPAAPSTPVVQAVVAAPVSPIPEKAPEGAKPAPVLVMRQPDSSPSAPVVQTVVATGAAPLPTPAPTALVAAAPVDALAVATVVADAPSNAPAAAKPGKEPWVLREGYPIGEELKRWGDRAGWKVIWALNNDVIVPVTTQFTGGDFADAASAVVKTLAENGALIRAHIFDGNKTLVVVGPGVAVQ